MIPHQFRLGTFTLPTKASSSWFRAKIILLIMAVTLSMLGLQFYIGYSRIKMHVSAVQDENRREAVMVVHAFDWYLQQLNQVEAGMGQAICTIFPNRVDHIPTYLLHQLSHHPGIINLLWLKPDGKIIASAGMNQHGPTPGNVYTPVKFVNNTPGIAEVRIQGKTYITVQRQIFHQGRLRGIIVAHLDPQKVLEYLPLPSEPRGTAFVFDSEGRFIAKWGNWQTKSTQLFISAPIRQALGGSDVAVRQFSLALNENKLMGVATPISILGWAVFSGVSEHSVSHMVYITTLKDTLGVLLFGVLLLVSAIFVTNRLLRNLDEIKEVAQAVAGGEKDRRVSFAGNDELVAVGVSFNNMLNRIQELENELNQLCNLTPDFIVIGDRNARIRYINPSLVKFLGLKPDNIRWYADHIHPADQNATQDVLRKLRESTGCVTIENRIRCADGTYRWVVWRTVAPEHSDIIYNIGRDITEQKRTEQQRANLLRMEQVNRAEAESGKRRFAYLAEASAILDSSLDYATTLSNLAQLSVPFLSDWCEINIIADDGSLQQVALATDPSVPTKTPVELLKRYPWSSTDIYGPSQTIRTGMPILIPEVTDKHLVDIARCDDHLKQLRQLALGSFMCVPLIARGHTLGAIVLVRLKGRTTFVDSDLQLAMDLAHRSALALDNARLYGETRNAESQLRQQLEFNKTITDNMVEGLCALDSEGRLVFINPTAERILGGTAEHLSGLWLHNILHNEPNANDSPNCTFLDQLRSGQRITLHELLIKHTDGSETPIEFSASPLHINGEYVGCVFVFQDITERKRAEIALRQAEEERDLSRMRFLQIAAHELRNPMAGVKGILSLVRRRQNNGMSLPKIIPMLDAMEHEIDRLSALLTEILEAFRVQEGQLRLEKVPINLIAVIRAALQPYEIAEDSTRFVLKGFDLPPLWVNGDFCRLEEVLRNLISNALKYSPADSHIVVHVQAAQGSALVSVADKGMGIPKDQLVQIFEVFYRASNLAGRDPGGIGLGLYICRDIVQRHDGKIWAESDEGAGTTFYVLIPLLTA